MLLVKQLLEQKKRGGVVGKTGERLEEIQSALWDELSDDLSELKLLNDKFNLQSDDIQIRDFNLGLDRIIDKRPAFQVFHSVTAYEQYLVEDNDELGILIFTLKDDNVVVRNQNGYYVGFVKVLDADNKDKDVDVIVQELVKLLVEHISGVIALVDGPSFSLVEKEGTAKFVRDYIVGKVAKTNRKLEELGKEDLLIEIPTISIVENGLYFYDTKDHIQFVIDENDHVSVLLNGSLKLIALRNERDVRFHTYKLVRDLFKDYSANKSVTVRETETVEEDFDLDF